VCEAEGRCWIVVVLLSTVPPSPHRTSQQGSRRQPADNLRLLELTITPRGSTAEATQPVRLHLAVQLQASVESLDGPAQVSFPSILPL
jgi:hypothetical protein